MFEDDNTIEWTDIKLKAYNGTIIKSTGLLRINVKFKDKSVILKLYLIKRNERIISKGFFGFLVFWLMKLLIQINVGIYFFVIDK